MKKTILILIFLILMIFIICAAKVFLIGEPMDADSLAIQIKEGDGQLSIFILSTDSARAIRDLQYRYEGTVLHITPFGVLSSPIYNDGEKCLYYEIVDETQVWVAGELVWSAQ